MTRWAACLVAVAACSRGGAAPQKSDASPAPSATAPIAAPTEAAAPREAVKPAEAFSCEQPPAVDVFALAQRVVAVSDRPYEGELRVKGGGTSDRRRGGPPYFWIADAPKKSSQEVTFQLRGCDAPAAKKVTSRARPLAPPENGIWPAEAAWSRPLENLYSAWIETLFDAPEGEMPSWPALHEVLRDPRRNVLFDVLGAGEDSAHAPTVRPDCADLPYFLRAYFAFKMRLPFGLAECNRGGGGAPPSCRGLLTNADDDVRAARAAAKKPAPSEAAVAAFGAFMAGTLADRAHSGSARTPFEDEASDYYPVRLTWEALRPGTTYADPYGHILVVARRVPQTDERGGSLIAVDGQPDGTVALKRFWRGNFLYATERELGGPGFKRFRPLVKKDGALARMDDASIAQSPDYGDLSYDASKLTLEGFYDAMDDLLSPRPLDPERAMMETVAALEEQVRTRVKSVDNGRKWLAKGEPPAEMPEGPEIFETTGAWEDFATPSRDLRLLIAIDVVRGFPARVARRSERYAMPPGRDAKGVEADLGKVLERELVARKVTYTRTDGSPFTLTLADVLARSSALETAYDLNDCVEVRWGAPAGSDEASTCRARAPEEQRGRMETYRAWFHERRRPPRK